MRHRILSFCLWVAAVIAPIPVLADQYRIVSADTTTIGRLQRTEFTVQVGHNPLNNFKFYRVKLKHVPNYAQRGVMLLVTCDALQFPGMYEDGDDYSETFAAYYADRNIDIWGVSHRYEKFVSPMCETGTVDCSIMGGWSMDTIVQDVQFVRSQIAMVHPFEKPVIVGQYFGAGTALAALNDDPRAYSGIVVGDGLLYTEDPAARELNQYWCDAYNTKLEAGDYWDGTSNPTLKYVVGLVLNDPSGGSPFIPGLTNLQVLVSFMNTPPPAPFTQIVPGYTLAVGDVGASRLVYADLHNVTRSALHFSDYIVNRFERDAACARAGVDTHHYDNLGGFRGHIYIAGGGRGAGNDMLDFVALTRARTVTANIVPEYGHLDLMMAPNHQEIYEKPIYNWLSRVVFRHY